jgi:hypothetical protein
VAAAGVTRRRLLKIFVVLLFAGSALRGLSALLLGMHVSGADPHSWSSLTPLRHFGGHADSARGVILGWHNYAQVETPGVANAWDVVQWGMAVDILLFAPMYALGLFLFIRSVRGTSNPLAVTLGLAATGIAFVADELENMLTLAVVGLGWHGHDGSNWFAAATWGLWTFSWVKWIGAAVALIVAVLLAVPFIRSTLGSWHANRPRLHVLRLHLVLVAFAAIVFFAHEQIPDLVRRWTPVTLAVTTALALGFALLIWASTRRLLTVALWSPPSRKDPEERKLELKILRVLVIVAVVQFGLHLLFHGEWDPGWGLVVPAAILGAVALAGLVVDPVNPADRNSEPLVTGEPQLPRMLASSLAIAFALGVFDASFGYAVYVHDLAWQSLIIPIGAGLGLAVWLVVKRYDLLAWSAGGGFAGAIVLAFVRGGQVQPLVLVLTALLLALLGWRLFDTLASASTPANELSTTALVLAVVVVLTITVGVIWKAIWVGEHLGAVGVLFAFLLASALVVSLIAWASPGIPVPRLLRALNAKTFPILMLLAAWFVLASTFDQGGYHDARVMDSPRAANGATLGQTFACWLRKNNLPTTAPCNQEGAGVITAQAATGATPLIMVATTGGGIRAAYWTALVLDCAFETATTCPDGPRTRDFTNSDRLFGVSGISGGSLGLASYAAYLIDKREGRGSGNWVSNALHVDALSGAGAWWLFTELPRSLLQFNVPDDRAAVQEKGWEERWPHGELGRGIFDVWHAEPQVPLLLLNGTSVTDGCRFEASALDGNVERIPEKKATDTPASAAARAEFAGCRSTEPFDESSDGSVDPGPLNATRVAPESVLPGTKDLVDYLCHRNFDVPLSTAALLSARFPFVNPSGRVPRKCETKAFRAPIAYVVDGGYLDTSGASPIVELMQPLGGMITRWNRKHPRRCVVPVMIQIDNGFDPGAAHEARPKELLVPSGTLSAARLGRAAEARSGAALLFDSATAAFGPVNRYAHFVNQVHAGPHAPLGWAQSEFSEKELESQLAQPENQQAFKEVRRWLTPGALACAA